MSKTLVELRHDLSSYLSENLQKKSPLRIIYLFLPYLYAIIHFYITKEILKNEYSWFIEIFSIVLFGNLATFCFFTMHELLHGSIFKSPTLTVWAAFFGGMPFLCTPEVWKKWHTHHHEYTMMKTDTDRYRDPKYDDFTQLTTRIHYQVKNFRYTNPLSYFMIFFVIIGQHACELVQGFLNKAFFKLNKVKAITQYIGMIFLFLLPFFTLGAKFSILWFYLPIALANLICNLYLLTNHYDNPLTEENYPLVNTTSVFLIPFKKLSHMDFGRHVEHHIFPHLTHNKLKTISEVLQAQHKEDFREKPIFKVLNSIYCNSKPIHK